MTPAAFVDRDGVINDVVWDPRTESFESPYAPADVNLMPGAVDGLAALRDAGFALVVVSNQPAAAKGNVPIVRLEAVHSRIAELLAEQGVQLDGAFYCHHHPQGVVPELSGACACRKPAPGLLLEAAAALELDLSASWMFGDADTDVEAAHAAGVAAVLIAHPRTAHRRRGTVVPELTSPDLAGAGATIAVAPGR